MGETIWFRGEGGAIQTVDSGALHPGIRKRFSRGDLVRLNPDGTPWTGESAEPAPVPAAGSAESATALAATSPDTGEFAEEPEARAEEATAAADIDPPPAREPEPGQDDDVDAGEPEDSGGEDGAVEDEDDDILEGPADAPPLPRKSASRIVWTEFAIGQGMDRAKAASMTKQQLIAELTRPDPAGE